MKETGMVGYCAVPVVCCRMHCKFGLNELTCLIPSLPTSSHIRLGELTFLYSVPCRCHR